MTKKKLLVILISIAFTFVVLFSCASILSIKKVEVNYALINADVQDVQNLLDENLNKNLLLLNEIEVENSLNSKPYLEVVSVDKKFPNVLSVSIKERREVFRIETDEKSYILDENGVVLNDAGEVRQNNEIIDISFISFADSPTLSKIEIVDAELGKRLHTSNDQALYQTLKIAKNIGLFDCINKIEIELEVGFDDESHVYHEKFDVDFETKTGVNLKVMDLLVDGERKGQACFDAYNALATDYQKRFGNIEAKYGKGEKQGKLMVVHIDNYKIKTDLFEEDI